MDDILGDFQRSISEVSTEGDLGVELLLSQLDPTSARLLRLCAIPHLYNPGILRALEPKLSFEEALEQCEQFSRLSAVLEVDDGWTLHDTARDHLFRNWLRPENRDTFREANGRLLNYLHERTNPGQLDWETARIAEHAGMFHLYGASPEEGFCHFVRLYDRASSLLWLEECEVLLNLVREYDPILPAEHSLALTYYEGRLAANRLKFDRAAELFQGVLARANGNVELRLKSLERLGMVYRAQRNWPLSIDHLSRAVEEAEAAAELRQHGTRAMQTLAATYRDMGELDKAEQLLLECVKLNEEMNSTIGLATTYNILGDLYRQLSNPPKAVKVFNQSLEHLSREGDRLRRAQVLNNLGLAYLDGADWESSRTALEESLEIKRELKDTVGEATALLNLSRVERSQGDIERAIELASTASRTFAGVGARYQEALARRALAKLYREVDNVVAARSELRTAKTLFARLGEAPLTEKTELELKALDRPPSKTGWYVGVIVLALLLMVLFTIFFVSLL